MGSKKLGLSVCENKIFMPKFAIFFAQIDIKLYNFLIAHEARKFFSFLYSLQNWTKGSLSVDWRKKWSLGVELV